MEQAKISILSLQKTMVECISLAHKSFVEMFLRYALNADGSWSGDLLIADTEDLKTMPPSEVHVERFTPKEVDIHRRDNNFTMYM